MNYAMNAENPGRQILTGWSLSVLLHGAVVAAVVALMPAMMVPLENNAFRWDVALVETPREPATAPPVPEQKVVSPAAKPQRRPVRPVDPVPQPMTRQIQTRETPQLVQRDMQAVVDTVKPIQRPEPAPEPVNVPTHDVRQTEPVVREVTATEVVRETDRPIEQTVMQPVQSVMETPREVSPVVSNQPSVEAREETVVAPAPMSTIADDPPIIQRTEPVSNAPAVTQDTVPLQEAAEPSVSAPPAPVIARSITPRPATKADYGWLADSLFRRVVELRHYPRTARLNGFEGKVVLRVSIKQDGHLDDVSVVQSSGHESLDNAAMEAVRRACPLHLKHELEKPKVVMTLPVTYRLGQ